MMLTPFLFVFRLIGITSKSQEKERNLQNTETEW